MCELISNISWFDLIQTLASVFVAFVAYRALATWKRQSKAQKQTDFLDELTDIVSEYMHQMTHPTQMLKMINIGIESYSKVSTKEQDSKYTPVISYIKKRGKEDAEQLWGYINKSDDSIKKIESLLAKGRAYDLKEYNICTQSCLNLMLQNIKAQGVASIIGSQYMNWNNPVVQTSLDTIMSIKPEDISNSLKEHNTNFLNFVKINYAAIYKNA